MNDSGRRPGPARGALKLTLDRVLVLHDEIDLPFGEVRDPPGRRPGRSQRPEVAAPRARLTRLLARAHGRRATAVSSDPDTVAAYVLARFREGREQLGELIERACEEVERIVGGDAPAG